MKFLKFNDQLFYFLNMPGDLKHFVFNCVQTFFLGIVQGVTEFLPISSTAHLKVVPYFLGWSDPGVSISASLQLGSAFAIIFYFRNDIVLIINSFLSFLSHRKLSNDEDTKLLVYVVIASLPILIVGLFKS